MKTSDFDYDLPPERIAQTPVEPRHASRLMLLDRQTGAIDHSVFRSVGQYLKKGDALVLNQTRVIPARIFAHKVPSGGKVELLLLRRIEDRLWEALVGGKGLHTGRELHIDGDLRAEIAEDLEGSRRLVRFNKPLEAYLERIGNVPLPPYIHAPLADRERYQTVYARIPGSAAAPTAGLHFTPELLGELQALGIRTITVTLHVGLDTFAPVTEEDPAEHKIHTEWCELLPQAAQEINTIRQNGGRIVAVGTTSVRTLESAARGAADGCAVAPFSGPTDLFILPGYHFHAVDAMITNFHLPRSTLLMLVSAFAGREQVLHAYQVAIQEQYRFYSFGDAMLIQ
jgi:S-adenosylmethionine:tRNA ribosyltransferase-isomerase